MSTIETCHIFPQDIELKLLNNGITNGLGGEGSNLEKIILEAIKIIENEKGFNNSKGHQLYKDIYRLHFLHDILFSVGIFYYANFIFARDLYKLLRGAKIKWIGRWKSFIVSLTIFILLCKFGRLYYKK